MYWSKSNKGLIPNFENASGFLGFASYKQVEAKAKKDKEDVKDLLKQAPIFSWVKTTKGDVKKGSFKTLHFERYATQEEVEKAGGELYQADLLDFLNPKTDNNAKK